MYYIDIINSKPWTTEGKSWRVSIPHQDPRTRCPPASCLCESLAFLPAQLPLQRPFLRSAFQFCVPSPTPRNGLEGPTWCIRIPGWKSNFCFQPCFPSHFPFLASFYLIYHQLHSKDVYCTFCMVQPIPRIFGRTQEEIYYLVFIVNSTWPTSSGKKMIWELPPSLHQIDLRPMDVGGPRPLGAVPSSDR